MVPSSATGHLSSEDGVSSRLVAQAGTSDRCGQRLATSAGGSKGPAWGSSTSRVAFLSSDLTTSAPVGPGPRGPAAVRSLVLPPVPPVRLWPSPLRSQGRCSLPCGLPGRRVPVGCADADTQGPSSLFPLKPGRGGPGRLPWTRAAASASRPGRGGPRAPLHHLFSGFTSFLPSPLLSCPVSFF